MASVSDRKLVDDETLSGAGPHVGSAVSTEQWMDELIAVCTCTNAAGNTADVTVQHSPDGTNWHTLATIPTVTGNDQEIVAITAASLPRVRASTTLGGAQLADVTVQLFFSKK